ncbi:hypothetical protein [Natrialba sp. PRR66]|uniref:hypothetical protein n=1 Tax=Natrialba sp. PRR66 TaxID=3098146 RepID=UPI002B1E091D|nr:hypothetical protein [Natrialba sp. PRR66]
MGKDSRRSLPDKTEALGLILCSIIIIALAVQAIDNPISVRGVGQIVGISMVYLLVIWWLYAKPVSGLTVSDLWLGIGLFFISSCIIIAVLLVNSPIKQDSMFSFVSISIVILLWSFIIVFRPVIRKYSERR